MSDPIALPGRALAAWRAEAVLAALALGAIAFVVGWVWLDHAGIRLALLAGAVLVLVWLVLDLLVLLPRRHVAWSVRVDGTVLEVVEGVLIVRRLRVPLTQVLYVDVRQGPVVRVLGLSRVRVGTLGSAHDVGPFAPEVADALARHLAEVKG